MFIVEYLAPVGGARSNAPGIIAGFDSFRLVGNTVVCKYFMEGPAVGGAVDPVGDGVPHVHDVSQFRARRGGGCCGKCRRQGGQEGEREPDFHQSVKEK